MAWSSSAISASILAARAANKPLLGTNVIVAPSATRWVAAASFASTDYAQAAYPICRAYDGLPGLPTIPSTAASNIWYILFDLGSNKSFDSAAVMTSQSGLVGKSILIEVADDSAFSTNYTGIGTIPISTINRTEIKPLGDGSTLYSARYVAVAVYGGVGGANFVPEIGEVMLLRTRQLKSNPDEPWGPDDMAASSETTTTAGGVIHKTRWHERQRMISAQIVTGESTWADEIIAFHRECVRGNGSFVWCDRPTAAPASWNLMMRDDDNFQFPYSDFCRRELTLEAHEQGPQAYYLDVEVNG